MKIKYQEDPRTWRKSTLFSVLGLLILSLILWWRHALATQVWGVAVAVLVCVGILTWLRPRFFRGYYRFSTWAGFWSSQWVARAVLALMFLVIIVPAGV